MTQEIKLDNAISSMLSGTTLDALKAFVRLPCKSSDFDPDWQKHGLLKTACEMGAQWGKSLFPNATFDVPTAPDHTPALFFDIPATDTGFRSTVFFYGHFDKQPEAQGWTNGRMPFSPSLEGKKLYGRGAADDGYSFYSALTAVRALDEAGLPRGRVTGLIETDEESGSSDMPWWLDRISQKCGSVSLAVILDSTCCDYERLWVTTSFRGCINLTLNVKVLHHAVHSGSASGIVPDSFRIIRLLLSRLENEKTGEISHSELNYPVSDQQYERLKATAQILGKSPVSSFPWIGDTHCAQDTVLNAMIAGSLKPQLAILGADGLPSIQDAGRVIRPQTSILLSLRTPAALNAEKCLAFVTKTLTENPPYNADVTITDTSAGDGWRMNDGCQWFDDALEKASKTVFGKSVAYNCDGASIPTLNLMQRHFPNAQLLVTGVLGPNSNAHGPDEMLRLDYLENLTKCIARIIRQGGKADAS